MKISSFPPNWSSNEKAQKTIFVAFFTVSMGLSFLFLFLFLPRGLSFLGVKWGAEKKEGAQWLFIDRAKKREKKGLLYRSV